MIMHSLTLGLDINLSGELHDNEIEAIFRDLEDKNMAPGVRVACEAAVRREMSGMPSSYGEDDMLDARDREKMAIFVASGGTLGGIKDRFPYCGSFSDAESIQAIDAFNERRAKYYIALEDLFYSYFPNE
jgi:hypothetical protein